MSDVVVKQWKDTDFYKGQGSIPGIRFHSAGRALGVTAWGMNVLEIEAGCNAYPEHDHTHDNQEEVFLVLRGGGEIEIDGERFPFDGERIARVAPDIKRKLWPGEEGIRVVILGGVPGQVYEAADITKLGEPDPMLAN